MKKLFATTVLFALFLQPALAENGYWEQSLSAYNIYSSGGTSTRFYTPTNDVPRNGTYITAVVWSWESFDNNFDNQLVELCYRQQYHNSDTLCLDVSDSPSYFTNAFDGYDARGSFLIRFTLEGGDYPAIGALKGDGPDIVGVYYNH